MLLHMLARWSLSGGDPVDFESKKKDAATQPEKPTKHMEEVGDCRQAYVWIDSPPSIVLCGISFPIQCALPLRSVPPLRLAHLCSGAFMTPTSIKNIPSEPFETLQDFSGFFAIVLIFALEKTKKQT